MKGISTGSNFIEWIFTRWTSNESHSTGWIFSLVESSREANSSAGFCDRSSVRSLWMVVHWIVCHESFGWTIRWIVQEHTAWTMCKHGKKRTILTDKWWRLKQFSEANEAGEFNRQTNSFSRRSSRSICKQLKQAIRKWIASELQVIRKWITGESVEKRDSSANRNGDRNQ